MVIFLVKLLCVYIATVGFGVLLNVPRQVLNWDGLVGIVGFIAYSLYTTRIGGNVAGSIISGFTIGIAAFIAAKVKKMPAIEFDIPALMALVPGSQAYDLTRNFAMGNLHLAVTYLAQVAFIAGAIAVGFLLSELLIQLVQRLLKTLKYYSELNKEK